MMLPGKNYAYLYVVALAKANDLEFPLSKTGFLYHIENYIPFTFQARENAIRYYSTKILYEWLQEAMPNDIFLSDASEEVLAQMFKKEEEERKRKRKKEKANTQGQIR